MVPQLELSFVYLAINASVLFPGYCGVCIILQVPDSGSYTFYMSCDDWCELWMYDVDEYGTENRDKTAGESFVEEPIIVFHVWTGHLEWNK